MNKKLVIINLILLISISMISAEIFLSKQPNQIYTLGENLAITLGSDGSEGWATINLQCSNQTTLLFFSYLTEEDLNKNLKFPLTKEFLRGMNGECFLNLKFKEQNKESLKFTILDHLDIDITFDSLEFDPGQIVKFSGNAKKPTGQEVNGFVEISLENTEIESVIPIEKNNFNGELILPENIESGNYNLIVFAYEKENDEITNNGMKEFNLNILQKPTSLEISIQEEITPGEDLEFKAILYDQAEKTIDGKQVSLTLTDSKGEKNLDILSSTGDSNYYKVRKNTPIGYMNITAKSLEIITEKQIYVNKNEEASFNLINETLVIQNIGNTPYNKFVKINIGNHSEIKSLNLSLGQLVEFRLEAPNGQYNISISDGNQEIENHNVLLTGKAIGVKPNKQGLNLSTGSLLAWIFIIMIFGLFIFVSSKKYLAKRKSDQEWGFNTNKKQEKGGVVKVNPVSIEKISKNEIPLGTSASHSLVLSGEKQNSCLLALKIKNLEEIKKSKSNASETIAKAIDTITENHGKVYQSEGYIIGIFAPIITKTFDNSVKVVNIANEVASILNEHNRKYAHKISFGIGINSGDLIAKKESGKLLFTPLLNTLTDAKRISEIAENFVLVGENTSKEIGTRAKFSSYPAKIGLKTYVIKEMLDQKRNNKFINSFLERNSEYKKLDEFRL
jgi:hypothetical protein